MLQCFAAHGSNAYSCLMTVMQAHKQGLQSLSIWVVQNRMAIKQSLAMPPLDEGETGMLLADLLKANKLIISTTSLMDALQPMAACFSAQCFCCMIIKTQSICVRNKTSRAAALTWAC